MAPLFKQNAFSDCRNRLYGKSASLRCGGKLFHSPGPAAAKALSPKLLWVGVMTHVRLSVERSRLYVCMSSVTLVHPAKTVGQFEMPFGRDSCVFPSNIILDRGPCTPRKWKDFGSELPVCSDVACC